MDTITLSSEAQAYAEELAALDHITVTQAVTRSLREALARRRSPDSATRLARMRAVSDRFADIMRQDPDAPSLWQINEDLYDERGLPK